MKLLDQKTTGAVSMLIKKEQLKSKEKGMKGKEKRMGGGGVFKGRKYRKTKIVSVRAESKEC